MNRHLGVNISATSTSELLEPVSPDLRLFGRKRPFSRVCALTLARTSSDCQMSDRELSVQISTDTRTALVWFAVLSPHSVGIMRVLVPVGIRGNDYVPVMLEQACEIFHAVSTRSQIDSSSSRSNHVDEISASG